MARTARQPRREAQAGSSQDGSDSEESDGDYSQATRPRETQLGNSTQGNGGLNSDSLKARGAQLARFALFMEYKRRPITRRDATSTVVPDWPRSLNAVIKSADEQLKDVFGMEIVEYRTKQKIESGGKGKGKEKEEDGEEEKVKGSSTYGLRNNLPIELIKLMNEPRAMPGFPIENDEYKEDGDTPGSGALLRWEKGDGGIGHVALLGVRTVILSLILCSGRMIQDDDLHALLKRLNLYRDTVLPFTSSDSKDPPMTLDKYLNELDKLKYLEKRTIPGPNGSEGGATIEWRWGSREVEFTEAAAAQFIEDIFEADEDDSDSEDETDVRRGQRDKEAEREKKKRKLKEDITKAAGSELAGEL